jgi:hypothetical protein
MATAKATHTRQPSRPVPLLAGDLDRLNDHLVLARRSILTAMDRRPDLIELTTAFDLLDAAIEIIGEAP